MRYRLAVLLILSSWLCPLVSAGEDVKIERDVVYGHKDGLALTFDVVLPHKPNGAAVLWLMSAGWASWWVDASAWPVFGKPYLDRGFTLIAVRHGGAPKYTIPEATDDVRRCVRFLHMKGKDWGIDPERLGVYGMSSGGHLSLMLGTTGDDGDPKATDEVLRHSSRVAAVVAVAPPTDIRDWVTNPPAEIRNIPALKPPLTFAPEKAPDYSPLLQVTDRAAPTLLIHGDKDNLVPIAHSRNMLAALEKAKVACKLIVVDGGGHGFTPKQDQEIALPATLDWFTTHLTAKDR